MRASLHDDKNSLPILKCVDVLYHVLMAPKQAQDLHLALCIFDVDWRDELRGKEASFGFRVSTSSVYGTSSLRLWRGRGALEGSPKSLASLGKIESLEKNFKRRIWERMG